MHSLGWVASPSSPENLAFERGEAYAAKGKWEQAIPCYIEAIQHRIDFTPAYGGLGRAYFQNNQPEKALETFDDALCRITTVDPNLVIILTDKGNVLHALQRYENAIESYRKVAERPLSTDWYSYYCTYSIGKCYVSLGNQEKARSYFEDALANIPRNAPDRKEVLLIQAAMLESLERYEKVLQTYEELEEYIPDFDCPTLLNKGVALQHLCKHEEAIGIYELIIHRLVEEDNMQDIKLAAEVNKALVFLAQRSIQTAKEIMDNIRVNPEDVHAMSLYKKCLDAFNISTQEEDYSGMLHKIQPISTASLASIEPIVEQEGKTGSSSCASYPSVFIHSTQNDQDEIMKNQSSSVILPDDTNQEESTCCTGIHFPVFAFEHMEQWSLAEVFRKEKPLQEYTLICFLPDNVYDQVEEDSFSSSPQELFQCIACSQSVLSNALFLLFPFRCIEHASTLEEFLTKETTRDGTPISFHFLVLGPSSPSALQTFWVRRNPSDLSFSPHIPPLLNPRFLPRQIFGFIEEIDYTEISLLIPDNYTLLQQGVHLDANYSTMLLVRSLNSMFVPILQLFVLSNPIFLNRLLSRDVLDTLMGIVPCEDESGFTLEVFHASEESALCFQSTALHRFLEEFWGWFSVVDYVVPLLKVEKEIHSKYQNIVTWVGRSVHPETGHILDRTKFHFACIAKDGLVFDSIEFHIRQLGFDFLPETIYERQMETISPTTSSVHAPVCNGFPLEQVPLARKISAYCWTVFGFSQCNDTLVLDQLVSSSLPLVCVHPRHQCPDLTVMITYTDSLMCLQLHDEEEDGDSDESVVLSPNSYEDESFLLTEEETKALSTPWLVCAKAPTIENPSASKYCRTGLVLSISETKLCVVTTAHDIYDKDEIFLYPCKDQKLKRETKLDCEQHWFDDSMDLLLLSPSSPLSDIQSYFPNLNTCPTCDPGDAVSLGERVGVKYLRVEYSKRRTLCEESHHLLTSRGLQSYRTIIKFPLSVPTNMLLPGHNVYIDENEVWKYNVWKLGFGTGMGGSRKGDCGTPYYLFRHDQPILAGIHLAGDGKTVLIIPIWKMLESSA